MNQRPRRNRKTHVIRELVSETRLHLHHLIFPMFLIEGKGKKEEVTSMPGIYRYSLDTLETEIDACMQLGLRTFCLFPSLPDEKKDKYASESTRPEGLYLHSLKHLKQRFPDACLMTDVAMDPYSSDGHDGLVRDGEILNDETLEILGKMAVAQARAGADILGPSDMMDGRIGHIRNCLDEEGFTQVSIMSYTAKYASAFYGPFRDALDSAPRSGDKKTYQMNPANRREAIREARLDEAEGADILMVKPALAYLDVIAAIKTHSQLPVAAYHVSGEYAMIKAAGQNGWLDPDAAMWESLLSIRRAGADVILTYFAREVAQALKEGI